MPNSYRFHLHKGHGHKTMIPQGQKLNIVKVMFKMLCLEKGHNEFQVFN